MTTETLQAVLINARNNASQRVTELSLAEIKSGEEHAAMLDDALLVVRASEIALGMIWPGFVPERKAREEACELLSCWE